MTFQHTFRPVRALPPGDPSPAVAAPSVPQPGQTLGWDGGVALYREVFGAEAWAKYGTNSYPRPMPPPSEEARLGLSGMVQQARVAFGLKAFESGRRATHTTGVAGRGSVTVVAKPDFPEHPFFQAGRRFACRLRHANASYNDDAGAVVRGCSLKFADSDFESPLDLIMNSGPIGAFWNIESFMDFVHARVGTKPEEDDWTTQREWTLRRPMGFIGSIESIRIAPSSFAAMGYYSKIVFPFEALDGVERYVKFRLIPAGMTQESGLPSPARQRTIWAQARDPSDTRPYDYLRTEYADRLAAGSVEYTLQLQLRDASPADTQELFNMCHLWDEGAYPWRDLAQVQVDELLPAEVEARMKMWLAHQPPGLGLLGAESIYDYRSMGYARALVYPAGQVAREVYHELHGAPPPLGPKPFAY